MTRLATFSRPFSIGEEKELAILFADIRGVTEFSERLPPYDVIYILNRYFYHMGKIISAHDGSIENYIDDGLMALLGLDDSPGACFRAVSAGLRMIEDIARNRQHFEDIYGMSFQIGVGNSLAFANGGPVHPRSLSDFNSKNTTKCFQAFAPTASATEHT